MESVTGPTGAQASRLQLLVEETTRQPGRLRSSLTRSLSRRVGILTSSAII